MNKINEMMNFAKYLLENSEKIKKKIFINKKIKYSELNKIINSVVNKILSNYKNQLFGMSLELSEEFLIFYLSIIRSGNTVVLIEKGLSDERYAELCKKFKINFFITDKKFQNINFKISKKCFKVFNIHKSINNLTLYLTNFQNKQSIKIKDVAVVMLTSGSTGVKKGVMLTHQNLISNTNSILRTLPITQTDIVNLILPVSYSFGLSVLNSHIKKKSNIFIHNSPFVGSLINELKKYKCTAFYGVPSTFEILINNTNFMDINYPNIKYVAQAGGSLQVELKKKLLDKFKNKFFVMYGTTEASPRLSFVPAKMLKFKLNSIGRPIPGVKFKLLKINKSKDFELVVKGKNIMKGYLNDEKLTKRKIKNGYFLTGDVAYKDKDGYYYITKRIDKTIKRYGFKVNLDLIENEVKKIEFVKYAKIFLSKENKLILLVQSKKKMGQQIKKQIDIQLVKKFASYEMPDEIILYNKKLSSYKKKLSVEEIFKISSK